MICFNWSANNSKGDLCFGQVRDFAFDIGTNEDFYFVGACTVRIGANDAVEDSGCEYRNLVGNFLARVGQPR